MDDETGPADTRAAREYPVCRAEDLAPGERRLVTVRGRSIGVFNVEGRLYALHNRCPHRGAALCEGRITGTTLTTDGYRFDYGREGEIIRCVWHGWEFEIASGRALGDRRITARSYAVTVRDGHVLVRIPGRPKGRPDPLTT